MTNKNNVTCASCGRTEFIISDSAECAWCVQPSPVADGRADDAPAAWQIKYTAENGTLVTAIYGHNAIADYRELDPGATVTELYTAEQLQAARVAAMEDAAKDKADAERWRRLVNASEMPFPVAAIANDPENDCVLLYGRKRLEAFMDGMDEISAAAGGAR